MGRKRRGRLFGARVALENLLEMERARILDEIRWL